MKTFNVPRLKAVRILIPVFLCLLIQGRSTGQLADSIYLPQINLEADPGFGPYIVGAHSMFTLRLTNLPEHTSSVMYRFIDVDSVQIGDSYTQTGTDIAISVYQVWLDEFNLPLSPRVHIQLTYQTDSVANYFFPFVVYPDTVSLAATAGWGPFITNNYQMLGGWNPVAALNNTFRISNLPTGTEEVDFSLVKTDSSTIQSFTVTAPQGEFLDSASWQNINMSNLPVNTMELSAVVKCNGSPDQGLLYSKPLTVVIQKPVLLSRTEGVTLTDSIATFMHKPLGGQALYIDSTKYAVITNGPGIKNTQSPYYYRGPLSFNVLNDDYTIEGWILIDGKRLAEHQNQSMSFLRIDSLIDISIFNDEGVAIALNWSSLVGGELLQLAYMDVSIDFSDVSWHHFAVVAGDPQQYALFYFDGQLMGAYINDVNYNYISNTYNVNNYLKTKPLVIGGCNGQSKGKSPDYTFIKAVDEVRIWNTWRSEEQIQENMNKSVLQDPTLAGYWDFDDMRNRLDYVSDESFNNNSGILKGGAAFIPENPNLFTLSDTLTLKSSNSATDSVSLAIYDADQVLVTSVKQKTQNHQVGWICDLTSLPFTSKRLVCKEHFPGCPDGGQETDYNLHILAPVPVATPMCNWGTYYQSDTQLGNLSNSILVNGFPANTSKVELGLVSGSTTYNADVFTQNSVPYQYCLTLNGTDNYIKTNNQLTAPTTYEISLWFRTTTTAGGMLIGFCDSPDGVPGAEMDRKIVMRKDGSLYFWYDLGTMSDTLFAANKYNDGQWHCVTVNMNAATGSSLSVDGCQVDNNSVPGQMNFFGYWVIGRHHQSVVPPEYAEYFQGSLAYINIWTSSKEMEKDRPLDWTLLNGAHRGTTLYRLDEGGGTTVHDSQGGNNGTLMGSTPNWSKSTSITSVVWQHNMIDKPAGQYTFYAKVYYPEGGESGVYYPLGIYNLADPLPNHNFSYYLLDGVGYFNEGVVFNNWFEFSTDYTGSGNPGWTQNVLKYLFISPDHQIIDQGNVTWTDNGNSLKISMDMGDAPAGSYLDIQIGYMTSSQTIIGKSFPIPILIRPMLAPKITGDFGPFLQAIAPGTMKQTNTFYVSTGEYNDLTKITADFYDPNGVQIASANGVKVNNTTWTISQDMSIMTPPQAIMKISYFLGSGEFLALQAGPYKIPITKTRPAWFDFLPDSAFSAIQENPDSVTFQVTTPFENNNQINNSVDFDAPEQVPLIGGSSASLGTPGANCYLKYMKQSSQLELDQPPDFFQKYVNLGAGNWETLTVGFNFGQSNSYQLDEHGNLIAAQNFTIGGSLSSGFEKFEGLITKIKDLIKFVQDADPESVIVKASFSLGYTGSFQYSSRVRLMTDTVTGQWGSIGNLDVDADPDHDEAYHNSASYHFYSGSLAVEFTVGMAVFEGIASGNFGIDGRIVMGYGHSYVTIPTFQHKPLKSLKLETYCRFYVDVLWGWYELSIWGPKMIYTHTFWDDKLDNVFPSGKKSALIGDIPTGIDNKSGYVTSFRPVSSYSIMPKPKPQSTVQMSNNSLIFNWLEKGAVFGERTMQTRFLDLTAQKFSDTRTMADNNHAPNNPFADQNADGISIQVWAQSRHDNQSFGASGNENKVDEFFRSQDIYYSVYNTENDSIIQSGPIEDDMVSFTSGRAEANPKVTMLSENRALITWQVVDPEIQKSDIWYAFLDNNGGQWTQSVIGPAVTGGGVKTQAGLEPAGDGNAVLYWLSTARDSMNYSTIMSSYFDGSQWTAPVTISEPGDVYCNYLDAELQDGTGGLAYTVFILDTVNGHHEKAKLVPWDTDHFKPDETVTICVDSNNHLQLPTLAVQPGGKAALALKAERMTKKEVNQKVSQIDVFQGDLNNLQDPWVHIVANPFVCDTSRQVAELNISFAGDDKYVILSQEYPLSAVNTRQVPQNGVMFGDPYMNLVFRSFQVNDDYEVVDVDENQYFMGIPEPVADPGEISNLLCYPNPCSDHTTLAFSLCRSTKVKADLCDANGTVIGGLIDNSLASGSYELEMNTMQLKPGIYIIRLATDHSLISYKLIVNR
jgi:hypothetical protein